MDHTRRIGVKLKLQSDNLRDALAKHKNVSRRSSRLTNAAVLLPIFSTQQESYVLLIKRSHSTKHHHGEIGLPGGTKEPIDSNTLETALRETEEELGIKPSVVDILGPLSSVATKTSFIIHPFVAEIPYPHNLTINHHEVARVIKLPINLLMQHDWLSTYRIGNQFSYYYGSHLIWGATARILKEFSSVIEQSYQKEIIYTC